MDATDLAYAGIAKQTELMAAGEVGSASWWTCIWSGSSA